MINTSIAHYRVTAKLGEGGMGEVYRATDTRLNRDVALKILPEQFAADSQRMGRFQREAEVLASLDHPNIGAIYGIEAAGATKALVLQLIEGPTLAERIAAGPIPVDEALPIAIQIAEALEAAHERGIIHRDLKPANIKVTPDGQVRLLDFGLAKALEEDPGSSPDLTHSPTMTARSTQAGVLLGTAAYMSPEQARGQPVDRGADIWAFGAVLFEMLSGRQAFEGDTISDVLAAVLKNTPDWEALPAVPWSIERLLKRLLQKDRRVRLQHIGDARIEIVEAMSDAAAEPPAAPASTSSVIRSSLLIAGTALVTVFVAWALSPAPSPRPSASLSIGLPEGQLLVDPHVWAPGRYPPIAIAPDGGRVAYAATVDGGGPRLYVRELDDYAARPLPGTEGAELPFFSPDGQWIGFWANDTLQKVPAGGGPVNRLAEVRSGIRGAVWVDEDTIVLGGVNRGLHRIDPDGGPVEELTQTRAEFGEEYHGWPSALPDGDRVLFSAVTAASSSLGSLSLSTGEWSTIEGTADATQARYLESGHLVFFKDGSLLATPFGPSDRALSSAPASILDGVLTKINAGHRIGYFAVADNGTLIYVPGGTWSGENEIRSVNRNGVGDRVLHRGVLGWGFDIDRAGSRLLVCDNRTGNGFVWSRDLNRGTETLLIEGSSIFPVWNEAAGEVLVAWFTGGSFDVYAVSADGSGERRPLLEREYDQYPAAVSPDGRRVAILERNPDTGNDIHIISVDDGQTTPLLATRANENDPAFSPEGRFLAYTSDVSGRPEVYVRLLEGPGGQETISTGGGRWPRWSDDGKELFYINGSELMAVAVTTDPDFEAAAPQRLFSGPFDQWWDLAPDGSFLMMTKPSAALSEIRVVTNWFERLERLAPAR